MSGAGQVLHPVHGAVDDRAARRAQTAMGQAVRDGTVPPGQRRGQRARGIEERPVLLGHLEPRGRRDPVEGVQLEQLLEGQRGARQVAAPQIRVAQHLARAEAEGEHHTPQAFGAAQRGHRKEAVRAAAGGQRAPRAGQHPADFAGAGQIVGRPALRVARAGVDPLVLQQRAHVARVAAEGRDVQRRAERGVAGVGVLDHVEELPDHRAVVALARRKRKRQRVGRKAGPVGGVAQIPARLGHAVPAQRGPGAVPAQHLDRLQLVVQDGGVERRAAAAVGVLDVGAAGDQDRHQRLDPARDGEVQRRLELTVEARAGGVDQAGEHQRAHRGPGILEEPIRQIVAVFDKQPQSADLHGLEFPVRKIQRASPQRAALQKLLRT